MKSALFTSLMLAVCLNVHAQKQVLTVAAFPAVDKIVKDSVEGWKKNHPNVEVNVVSRAYADHHTAMTTALATASSMPDLIALEYGYLGRFAQSGGLEDLNQAPYLAAQYAPLFVNYAYKQGFAESAGQVAMPTDIGPGALFYRKDLLDKAGLKESDLTQSWESYLNAGKKIKASTGAYLLAHARDIKDIVIRANVPAGEGVYFNKAGQVTVTSARFVRAFELAKMVREQQLDGKINAWSNEWGESFKRGTVATQMMGAWLGGHLSNWLAPDTTGKWRSAKLPEGVQASWGGTFYAIPKRATEKALAWSLMQHLTLNAAQQQKAFESNDAFPALLKAQEGAFFDKPVVFLGQQKARLQWRESARAIAPTAVFKHDAIAEEIVNAELDLVLSKNKAVSQALSDASQLIERRARR